MVSMKRAWFKCTIVGACESDAWAGAGACVLDCASPRLAIVFPCLGHAPSHVAVAATAVITIAITAVTTTTEAPRRNGLSPWCSDIALRDGKHELLPGSKGSIQLCVVSLSPTASALAPAFPHFVM